MKAYYYCMGNKNVCANFIAVCAGKQFNDQLRDLYEEQIKMYEVTECPIGNDIVEPVLVNRFGYLRKDGTIIDDYGNVVNFPKIKNIEPAPLTSYDWFRGMDGKLYDRYGEEIPESCLLIGENIRDVLLQKTDKGYKLCNNQGLPYIVPKTRLTDLDTEFIFKNGYFSYNSYCQEYYRKYHNSINDFVEIESKRVLFGKDIILFSWNGLTYKLHLPPIADRRENRYVDVAYAEDYDLDDIVSLVAPNIYIDKKGKIVLMEGWDKPVNGLGRKIYSPEIVKALKWTNIVECEVLNINGRGEHLVAKTNDGRILSTFDSDLGVGLKNVVRAFVTQDFAYFITK